MATLVKPTIVAEILADAVGIVVNTTRLNVRLAPEAQAVVIERLESGAQVRLLARNGDASWLYVRTPSGKSGWVNARFIMHNLNSLLVLPVRN